MVRDHLTELLKGIAFAYPDHIVGVQGDDWNGGIVVRPTQEDILTDREVQIACGLPRHIADMLAARLRLLIQVKTLERNELKTAKIPDYGDIIASFWKVAEMPDLEPAKLWARRWDELIDLPDHPCRVFMDEVIRVCEIFEPKGRAR